EIMVKGGIVMIPLIICSIISVAVITERAIFWLRQRKGIMPAQLIQMAQDGKFEEIFKEGEANNSYIGRVILSGIWHHNASPTLAMETSAIQEIANMKRYLPAMDTIITLAPLLGLLGTIVGMIRSFDIMSIAGIGQPHAVTGGVAEALIATAFGLTVAIVTLVPYNYFLSKVEKATEEMEQYATRLELILVKQK
ncbi:MAG TPA: MotA/TolQ/ExbB proton channel family protein, partial [Thermodesulfobacteriota bacterium]|nr:MotA/TolQ/ExbB proton channel family protein [Thermodesulfobacteriota bacterium]